MQKKKVKGSLDNLFKVVSKVRPDLQKDIDAIRSKLSSEDVTNINDMYDNILYPHQSLYYTQVRMHDANLQRIGLSPCEQAVLSLMERCASQSGLVMMPLPTICDEIAIGSHKTVQKAIKVLLSRDLIRIFKKGSRYGATIYAINPYNSNVGNNTNSALQCKNKLYSNLDEPIKTSTPTIKYKQGIMYTLDDEGNKVAYGTLIPINPIVPDADKKSSPEVAATTPGTGDDNKIVSSLVIENAINDDELPF